MIPALSLLSYPQECPYGEGDVYYGFQNPYLLVYLPVSLGTASQRAQAPPGVACPYNFPAVLDLPSRGPSVVGTRGGVNGLGVACFLALEGAGEEWGVGGGRHLWGRKR